MDELMCRLADWCTDHAALIWGVLLLVVFPALIVLLRVYGIR